MKDTFIMIKPDATERKLQLDVQRHLIADDFQIVEARTLTLQDRAASFLYLEHSVKDFFGDLVAYTCSGPVQLLWLRHTDDGATARGRRLVMQLRSVYALDKRRNSIHGSDGDEAAARELSYFFNWKPS